MRACCCLIQSVSVSPTGGPATATCGFGRRIHVCNSARSNRARDSLFYSLTGDGEAPKPAISSSSFTKNETGSQSYACI
jgi:hypothetical protein